MADRRKSSGKNRRDSHGVYERREARGKGRYEEGSLAKNGRNGRGSRDGRFEKNSSGRNERYERYEKNGRRQSKGYGASPDRRPDRRDSRPDAYRSANRNADRNVNRNDYREAHGGYRNGYYDDFDAAPRENLLVGRNPVIEALRAGRDIERIYMAEGAGGSISIIRALAKEQGVAISMVGSVKLNHMAPGEKHQGVVAEIPAYHYSEMKDIFAKAEESGEPPFVVILDELTDPHNVGAIIRTAECMGAHGVIIPNRRACGLTSTVAKSSAGAIERIPVVRVTNIGRTIDELKELGIWSAACDMDGESCYDAELSGAIAIVIGNEGRGISPLVKKKCDYVISVPMKGVINSLNASNAAAIIMSEIRHQRETRA